MSGALAGAPGGEPAGTGIGALIEAREAFGPRRGIAHEEVMRELLAPTYRWEAYLAGGQSLPDDEARRLDDAEKMVHDHFGISPAHYAYSHDAAERGVKLGDIVAYLVLQRELWEPDLREHPRPWTGPLPE
jgi:hypothetical protein